MQPVVDLVGQPQQGQLAQRRQVAGTEVVAQRRVDLVGGVDVAVRHSATERLGRHVDEFHLLGSPHDGIGHRLALRDAGDLLDDVVERLEMLHVDGADDVDSGGQQLFDVLPALLRAAARHVGVRQLVHEATSGCLASTASRSSSSNSPPR